VLGKLRRRFYDRCGSHETLPCFRLLVIDTDPDTLRGAERAKDGESLAADELLYLPLRRSANYRST
jgi:hypothetical protein